MANLPADVGYLSITAYVVEALADSIDSDSIPDILPTDATVLIVPVGIPATRPYVVSANDQMVAIPASITCNLTGGILYPPADGRAHKNGVADPAPPVTLVAPNQPAIDFNGWYWEARFIPPPGAQWKQFSIPFTGAPGDTVALATAVAQMAWVTANTAVQQPSFIVQAGTTLPATAKPGMYLLDTDTGNIYLIGA